jgi:hypothetical protein
MAQQAAELAASSTGFGQILPPIATVFAAVLAALITGFGAARLQHKWDAEADEKKWQHDSNSRNRARRLDAFAQYLSARPDLRAAKALTTEPGRSTAVVSDVRLAAANLLILLPDPGQHAIVEQDLQTVEDWIDLWLKQPAKAIRTDVPSVQPILNLARQLVIEPSSETTD